MDAKNKIRKFKCYWLLRLLPLWIRRDLGYRVRTLICQPPGDRVYLVELHCPYCGKKTEFVTMPARTLDCPKCRMSGVRFKITDAIEGIGVRQVTVDEYSNAKI